MHDVHLEVVPQIAPALYEQHKKCWLALITLYMYMFIFMHIPTVIYYIFCYIVYTLIISYTYINGYVFKTNS